MNRYAVVVVRWRGGREVSTCLRSVFARGGAGRGRVVLVDSGSGDGGAREFAAEFRSLQVEQLDVNLGFAHAANRGAALCEEPLLLLLNPDTELRAGAAPALLEALDERPRCAAAVPLLEDLGGESQHQWQLRRLPSPARLAAGLPGRPAFAHPPKTVRPVEQPAAAAWMVRRRAWRELGGLDPAYRPAWWEDVDFCRRLRELVERPGSTFDLGFVAVPEARVRHAGGSSLASLGDEAFLVAYTSNLLRYAARHHPGRLAGIRAGLRIALRVRQLARPGRSAAYAAALEAVRTATPGAPAAPPPAAGDR